MHTVNRLIIYQLSKLKILWYVILNIDISYVVNGYYKILNLTPTAVLNNEQYYPFLLSNFILFY